MRRPIHVSLAASLIFPLAAVPTWPNICTPPGAAVETRCPAHASCAPNAYSLSGWGCSPHLNATICNNFQSCPSVCSCVPLHGNASDPNDLHAVFSCVDAATGADFGVSRCSCKPGAAAPPSPTLKNVLVIGDSISIGYTPFLQRELADVALVQHAPFSSDGGAEESAYALQCTLPYWLGTAAGERVAWDVIYANNGMHNTNQGAAWTVPGQSGEVAAYAAELGALLAALAARAGADGSRLLVGITSPMLCNASADRPISTTINPAARATATALGLPTVDLYAAVTARCGDVPQPACFNVTGEFCPHASDDGYAWLAGVIAPAIRALL